MMKQSELEVMVCDLFVDAYRAGQSCGDLAYNAARGTRSRLIKELADLYAELESESYHREQFENELLEANHKFEGMRELYNSLQDEILRLHEENDSLTEEIYRRKEEKAAIFNGTPCPGMKTRLSEIYGSKLTDPDEEVPDHHDAFDAMFPGCTPDDLPFPDVAVAGLRPATTEASADAEGEAEPASELLGGDE